MHVSLRNCIFTVWLIPEFNASTVTRIWITPSSLPARISSKNDEIPLPKNQWKCLEEKPRLLKSAYVRAFSARAKNSAFYARWAKTRASAACASISPPWSPIRIHIGRVGGTRILQNWQQFCKFPETFRKVQNLPLFNEWPSENGLTSFSYVI